MQQIQTKMGLIEIGPAYVDAWRKWGESLMSGEYEEALASLVEEGLSEETVSLIELDGRYYLCFLSCGEGLPANNNRVVNQKHRRLLDVSKIRKVEGTILYSLKAARNE